jgi:phage-related holin
VRFPDHYCWYVLTSTLDVLVTFIIIEVYRGGEANRVASHIFDRFGWPGMIALKYATVLVVIGVCEVVARKNESLARNLAVLAVAVGAFPVLYGFMLVRVWMG